MATDRELFKKAQLGSISSANGSSAFSDAKGEVEKVHRRTLLIRVPAETGANTAVQAAANIAELSLGRVAVASKVIAAHVVTDANVATDASDYVTLTLAKRTSGGAATTVASYATNSAALVEWTAKALTNSATASALELAAGDVLTYKGVKAANGKIMGNHAVVVVVEEI